MEIESPTQNKSGFLARITSSMKNKVFDIGRLLKKTAQDDPRRVTHSFKVGLTLALVSSFYYYQPFFHNFGVSAMWAVMTVVVVFEFSVGATLGKGVNRGVATLVAGALGVGAHHLASLTGHIGEPIILAFFVFLQAAMTTFVRFCPKIKARYDYGMLIFILTFALISVSGFREDQIIDMANKRLSTIIIGGSACIIVSIVVFPVWAGQDLHNLIALNIQKLGDFLQGFDGQFGEETKSKPLSDAYKSVLNSKSNEETFANFARWEPPHGSFRFRHPWKQYLKVGALTRECAYRMEAIRSCVSSEIHVSGEADMRILETCMKMGMECGKALKQLGLSVKTMTEPSKADTHIKNSKLEAENLKSLLKSGFSGCDILAVIPIATLASLLLDVVDCTERVSASVNQLSLLAHFRTVDQSAVGQEKKGDVIKSSSTKVVDCSDDDDVVIQVKEESMPDGSGNSNSNNQNGDPYVCIVVSK